ncbi:MAG: excinuclease ABC subunit UvrA [Spirochaetes bacterium]|nr:excinuclease ABC subunit UvrA [Spirochaetota bacterium]
MDNYVIRAVAAADGQDNCVKITVSENFITALVHLDKFSHIIIFVSAKIKTKSDSHPSAEIEEKLLKIKSINLKTGVIEAEGKLRGKVLIYDIKPYFPIEDRVRECISGGRINSEDFLSFEKTDNYPINQAHHLSLSDFITLKISGKIEKGPGFCRIRIPDESSIVFDKISDFSHIRVLWYFSRFDGERYRKIIQCDPPYEKAPRTGVFASRSPVRPNPIAVTTCAVIRTDRNRGIIEINDVDAFDKSPVIDVIPYNPSEYRVKDFYIPEWINHWGEWYEDSFTQNKAGEFIESDFRRLENIGRLKREDRINIPIVRTSRKNKGSDTSFISITGACENNLKNVSIKIPKKKITVFTGLSGSGKSSLAFDTIFAESSRRFMDSLSSSARLSFKQFERPSFERIDNLPPAIAVEQKSISRNSRSTVGTYSEISDYLRLLFSRIGIRHCPSCGKAVESKTSRKIAETIYLLHDKIPFKIHSVKTGKAVEIDCINKEREYFIEEIESLLKKENGVLKVCTTDDEEYILHTRNHCYYCTKSFFDLTPSFFSLNNPEAVCRECGGSGKKMEVSEDLIVDNPDKSILDGASAWWGDMRKFIDKPSANWMKGEFIALARKMKVDLELPWKDLPEDFRHKAIFGTDGEKYSLTYKGNSGRSGEICKPVEGAVSHIKRLFASSHGKVTEDFYLQFMEEKKCPECKGEKLNAEARFVTAGSKRFPELDVYSIDSLSEWVDSLHSSISHEEFILCEEIIEGLKMRIEALQEVGLNYVQVGRSVSTLSGGEAQRLKLASQFGCGLSDILYILDEPTSGLHAGDYAKIVNSIRKLRDSGNTVIVVEHNTEIIKEADYIADFGPGAGSEGGKIVASGTPEEIMKNQNSLTGHFLHPELQVKILKNKYDENKCIRISGARKNNLKSIHAVFPIGKLTCVIGRSGSGKSSLVTKTLVPVLDHYCKHGSVIKGDYDSIEGLEHIQDIVFITQNPIGRTPRSNPATYTGLFDEIRKIFARTEEAIKKNYKDNLFSFNSRGGACLSCGGSGKKKIEMGFMSDMWIACPECGGKRYNEKILGVKYKDKSIADILEMSVEEAYSFFSEDNQIIKILSVMKKIGLGYIKLGQSALTLSGGEAQRVRLSSELSMDKKTASVYVLDEPSTGLHPADVKRLAGVFSELVSQGNTVIAIEHNKEIIRDADHVIELGPEGGEKGGYVID